MSSNSFIVDTERTDPNWVKRNQAGRATEHRHLLAGTKRRGKLYADRCTAGEKVRKDGTLVSDPNLYAPCVPEQIAPRDRTTLRESSGACRARSRDMARADAKAYNSGGAA